MDRTQALKAFLELGRQAVVGFDWGEEQRVAASLGL
jgi:hypothetical protein